MSIQKHGIEVGCDQCVYASGDDQGEFDVTVPVTDEAGQQSSIATLHCRVTPDAHDVKLISLLNSNGEPVSYDAETQQRLSSMLRFVEDRRICGNRNICPAEVVEIVAKFSQA